MVNRSLKRVARINVIGFLCSRVSGRLSRKKQSRKDQDSYQLHYFHKPCDGIECLALMEKTKALQNRKARVRIHRAQARGVIVTNFQCFN